MSTALDFEPRVSWDVSVQSYLEATFGAKFKDMQKALIRPPLTRIQWAAAAAALAALSSKPAPRCVTSWFVSPLSQEVVKQVNARVNSQQSSSQHLAAVHALVPDAVMLPGQPSVGCVDYAATGGKEVRITRKTGEAVLRGAPIYAPGKYIAPQSVSKSLHETS
eukprot:scaffold143093_cov17-Tisochrysis_lutea.AAC.1